MKTEWSPVVVKGLKKIYGNEVDEIQGIIEERAEKILTKKVKIIPKKKTKPIIMGSIKAVGDDKWLASFRPNIIAISLNDVDTYKFPKEYVITGLTHELLHIELTVNFDMVADSTMPATITFSSFPHELIVHHFYDKLFGLEEYLEADVNVTVKDVLRATGSEFFSLVKTMASKNVEARKAFAYLIATLIYNFLPYLLMPKSKYCRKIRKVLKKKKLIVLFYFAEKFLEDFNEIIIKLPKVVLMSAISSTYGQIIHAIDPPTMKIIASLSQKLMKRSEEFIKRASRRMSRGELLFKAFKKIEKKWLELINLE